MRRRMSPVILVALPLLAARGAPARQAGAPAESPREFLERRVPHLVGARARFEDRTLRVVNAPTGPLLRGKGLDAYLGRPWPEDALDLKRWRDGGRRDELPLDWDREGKRFRLIRAPRGQEPSEAILYFTYYFLRAYDRLEPRLRASGSTLAVGAAALVASEAIYWTNWACLPAEVQDAAAIVNVLLLDRPELLDACFGAEPTRRLALIREAIDEMYGGKGAPQGDVLPLHADPSWLESAPHNVAGKGPRSLDDFLPPGAPALDRLAARASGRPGAANLTIRARILAASAPGRFGLAGPAPGGGDAAGRWGAELDGLVAAAAQELTLRSARVLAPSTAAERPFEPLKCDPSLLRPLLVMAAQAAGRSLGDAARQGDRAFLDALRRDAHAGRVLALAGPDPTFASRPDGPDGSRLVTLAWDKLLRTDPKLPGREIHFERVAVELVTPEPSGAGRPIAGVGVEALVEVDADGKTSEFVPIGTLRPGTRVRGVLDVAPPFDPAERFEPGPKKGTAWFTVASVVRRPLAESLEVSAEPGSSVLLGVGHRALIGFNRAAGWRRAQEIDPGSMPWSVAGDAPTLRKFRRVIRPEPASRPEVVELGLTWDLKRAKAHNVVVYSPDRKARMVVEARSVDAGPVGADAEIRQAGGGTLRIGEILSDRGDAKKAPSVLAAYALKDDADTWPAPALSPHDTVALETARDASIPEAIRLTFEPGGPIVVGPGNWLLVPEDGRPREKPVEAVPDGASVVSDVLADGTWRTVRLVGRERVPAPKGAFARVTLANLGWARVGPVLLSLDQRPKDEGAGGLAVATRMRMAAKAAPPAAADKGAGAGVVAAGLGHVPTGKNILEPALLFHPAGYELAAGKLAGASPARATRTVVVTAGRGADSVKIEVGPGQGLIVLRRDASGGEGLGQVAARGLKKGADRVLVVAPGGSRPEPWEVRNVEARFHARADLIAPTVDRSRGWLESPAEPGVAFAEGIGVVLGGPRGSAEAFTNQANSNEGGAGMGGTDAGPDQGKGAVAERPDGGAVPKIRPSGIEDKIEIPRPAMTMLRRRGDEMVDGFDREARDGSGATRLRAPRAADAPILAYWRSTLGTTGVAWPFGAAAIEEELRSWLLTVKRHRDAFLAEPRSNTMAPLCYQEMVLASWMAECGASETARLLVRDVVELAVYTASEPSRERQRFSDPGLPLLLYAPGLVLGPGAAGRVGVTGPAVQALQPLVQRELLDAQALDNLEIDLRRLFEAWVDIYRQQTHQEITGFYHPIPRPQAGESLRADEPMWKEFDLWARRQGRALAGSRALPRFGP